LNNYSNKEEQQRRVLAKLSYELGDEIMNALSNPQIIEIMLNSDGKLWFDYLGGGMMEVSSISSSRAENIICTVAASVGTMINVINPIIEAELPFNGSRFTGIINPVAAMPIFTIRKRPEQIFSLAEYCENGVITKNHVDIIRNALILAQNILVVGGTGSGKTTLVNALLNEISLISPDERIFIIEDTLELKCSCVNKIEVRTTSNIDITKLLRTSLRMRPDRIIIGEIRGCEANSLIKAWNTGHPGGISTIHANSALGGLIRLEQLIAESGLKPIGEIIANTINLVIFINRIKEKPWRLVKEVLRVKDYVNAQYIVEQY
jgi:type IV secretion system protein VirB11